MLSAGRESAREPKPAYHYDIRVAAATARAAQTAVPNNCHSSGLARFGSVWSSPVRFGSVRLGSAGPGRVQCSLRARRSAHTSSCQAAAGRGGCLLPAQTRRPRIAQWRQQAASRKPQPIDGPADKLRRLGPPRRTGAPWRPNGELAPDSS